MLGIEPRVMQCQGLNSGFVHIRQTDILGYTPSAVYIFLNIVFKYEDRLREIHTENRIRS